MRGFVELIWEVISIMGLGLKFYNEDPAFKLSSSIGVEVVGNHSEGIGFISPMSQDIHQCGADDYL